MLKFYRTLMLVSQDLDYKFLKTSQSRGFFYFNISFSFISLICGLKNSIIIFSSPLTIKLEDPLIISHNENSDGELVIFGSNLFSL